MNNQNLHVYCHIHAQLHELKVHMIKAVSLTRPRWPEHGARRDACRVDTMNDDDILLLVISLRRILLLGAVGPGVLVLSPHTAPSKP